MKYFAIAMATFLLAANAFAATPFSDVPRDHWAYDAITRCVETGILKGFDGKFHGKKLLNRYQMAVVVAKILDQTKGGLPMGAAPKPTDIQNLEALTIEFADELALLNVKVSTLEDSFVELKHDVEKLKGTGPAVASARPRGRGFDLKGFAAFSFVKTDDAAASGGNVLTPYTGNNNDATFFTSPLASLAIAKDLGEGIAFNFRLNNEPDVGAGNANTSVDHAFFNYKSLLGDNVDGNFGGFASTKFSMEHNGAFDTTDYTISPSFLNDSWRKYHMYGMQFTGAENKKTAGGIEVHAAIISGTDSRNGANNALPIANGAVSTPAIDEGHGAGSPGETGALSDTAELDGDPGFWAFLRKKRGNGPLGFNLLMFDNGGNADTTATGTDEVSVMQLGAEYAKDDIHFILQFLQSTQNQNGTPNTDEDTSNFFALFNYKVDPKQSFTLRMENYSLDVNDATRTEFTAVTFGYNKQVTENSMFQFEYLDVDLETLAGVAAVDADDSLIRFLYKVWF